MDMGEIRLAIESGKAALGIELGSTRIKAVLVDEQHEPIASGGYDCSGSLSYALAAAGLVNGPLTSGGFMSWGDAGPGRRSTVYANGGHAFTCVHGRRHDTRAPPRRHGARGRPALQEGTRGRVHRRRRR